MTDPSPSMQERLVPGLTCFGCGPADDNGLGHLDGGIISTLLDCHSAAAVLHEADVRGWACGPHRSPSR